MMKVICGEKFNTSLGTAFVVERDSSLQVGEKIVINSQEYEIQRIVFPSKPGNNKIVIIV